MSAKVFRLTELYNSQITNQASASNPPKKKNRFVLYGPSNMQATIKLMNLQKFPLEIGNHSYVNANTLKAEKLVEI